MITTFLFLSVWFHLFKQNLVFRNKKFAKEKEHENISKMEGRQTRKIIILPSLMLFRPGIQILWYVNSNSIDINLSFRNRRTYFIIATEETYRQYLPSSQRINGICKFIAFSRI